MRENSASPCTRICTIDAASGFCLGCGRTLAEISAWSNLSLDERRTLNAALPARLEALRQGGSP